jgi:hypothetical protein
MRFIRVSVLVPFSRLFKKPMMLCRSMTAGSSFSEMLQQESIVRSRDGMAKRCSQGRGDNQALEQTRDSVLRYGESVGCELLNFFVRPQMHLKIVNGLQAHFIQPDGPSRPGTDWIVSCKNGGVEHRVMVRTYSDKTPRRTPEQHASAAMAFVAGKLEQGWAPVGDDEPAELVVPDDFVGELLAPAKSRPWWKVW